MRVPQGKLRSRFAKRKGQLLGAFTQGLSKTAKIFARRPQAMPAERPHNRPLTVCCVVFFRFTKTTWFRNRRRTSCRVHSPCRSWDRDSAGVRSASRELSCRRKDKTGCPQEAPHRSRYKQAFRQGQDRAVLLRSLHRTWYPRRSGDHSLHKRRFRRQSVQATVLRRMGRRSYRQ